MKHNPIIVKISANGVQKVQIKRKYDAGGYYFTLREARTIACKLAEALAKYDAA